MKKVLLIMMTLTMLVFFCACGVKENNEPDVPEKTEEDAKIYGSNAYTYMNEAYENIVSLSEGVEGICFLAKEDTYRIDDDSELEAFAEAAGVDIETIQQSVADLLGKKEYLNRDILISRGSVVTKDYLGDWVTLQQQYNSFEELCLKVICCAYDEEMELVDTKLADANLNISELEEYFPDDKNLDSLKQYFNYLSGFYELCKNPEGNYDNVIGSFNDYKNDIRDVKSSLSYVYTN